MLGLSGSLVPPRKAPALGGEMGVVCGGRGALEATPSDFGTTGTLCTVEAAGGEVMPGDLERSGVARTIVYTKTKPSASPATSRTATTPTIFALDPVATALLLSGEYMQNFPQRRMKMRAPPVAIIESNAHPGRTRQIWI